MKKNTTFFKNPSACFYMIASIFIFILILKQFHFFEWIHSFLLVLKPLFFGAVMAFFLQPLMESHKKNRLIRIIFVYLVFIFSFLLLFFIIFFLILRNFSSFLDILNQNYPAMLSFMERYQILQYMDVNQIRNVLMGGYTWLMPFIQGFVSFLTTFSLSVIISFFISLESELIANEFIKYVKQYEKIFDLYHIFIQRCWILFILSSRLL